MTADASQSALHLISGAGLAEGGMLGKGLGNLTPPEPGNEMGDKGIRGALMGLAGKILSPIGGALMSKAIMPAWNAARAFVGFPAKAAVAATEGAEAALATAPKLGLMTKLGGMAGVAGKAAGIGGAAVMAYQIEELIRNPKIVDQQIDNINNKGAFGRAWEGLKNAPATIAAFSKESYKAIGAWMDAGASAKEADKMQVALEAKYPKLGALKHTNLELHTAGVAQLEANNKETAAVIQPQPQLAGSSGTKQVKAAVGKTDDLSR